MALTNNGLEIKRLPEIVDLVETLHQQRIDPNITFRDDEFLGQINLIISEQISRVWSLAEVVHDGLNINAAEGKALDDLAGWRGIYRLDSTKTGGSQLFRGTPGTVVSAGTLISSAITNHQYSTLNTLTLSPEDSVYARIKVDQVSPSTAYTITVNGVDYTMTTDTSPTQTEILTGLGAQVAADLARSFNSSVSPINGYIDLNSSAYDYALLDIEVSSNLYIEKVSNIGYVEAGVAGEQIEAANTVQTIVTPIFGLDLTDNPYTYNQGRFRETDEQLRRRVINSKSALGKCTRIAIQTTLRNTTGVSYAGVYENDTTEEDFEGRPPKSFEAVVAGGTDLNVAQAILSSKGCGIETHGSTTVSVIDLDGQPQEIKFSRPEVVNIAVRVEFSRYLEEPLPEGAEDTIRLTVLGAINDLNLGVDVIPKRLYGPIYTAVSGVEDLVVYIQQLSSPGDAPVPGSWQVAPIPIAARFFANTTLADIYVDEI